MGNQTLVFVVKKNKTVLENLKNDIATFITNQNIHDHSINSEKPSKVELPLLMIDDEADQASLDIAYAEAKSNENDGVSKTDAEKEAEEVNPSTINLLIRSILLLFKKTTFIGYTATPFANIFARTNVVGKFGEDLFPKDFIIMLNRPKQYMGPVEVFGINTSDSSTNSMGLPITRILDDVKYRDETFSKYHLVKKGDGISSDGIKKYQEHIADLLRWNNIPSDSTPTQVNNYIKLLVGKNIYVGEGFLPGKHTSTFDPNDRLKELKLIENKIDLPLSLKTAINSFLLACAARLLRKQEMKHFSMLIHVSRFTNVQNKLKIIIKEHLAILFAKIDAADIDLLKELENLWKTDFVPTSKAMMQNNEPYIYFSGKLHDWAEIKKKLPEVKKLLLDSGEPNVRVIHGEKKKADVLNFSDYETTGGLKTIAIGGNKLSRGLTLEGLMVSYYMRASSYYDTLMQMGRWFGYRPGYADLVRVFVSAELQENYRHIATAFEELRELFVEMSLDKKNNPINFGLRVATHPKLQITNIFKMKSGERMKIKFNDTFSSTIVLFNSEVKIKENISAASNLITSIKTKPDNKLSRPYNKKEKYLPVWVNVEAKHIINFFNSYKTHSNTTMVHSASFREYIEKTIKKSGGLKTWTVALYSNKYTNKKTKGVHELTKGFFVKPVERSAKDAVLNDYISTGAIGSGDDRFLYLQETVFNNFKKKFDKLPEDSDDRKAGIKNFVKPLLRPDQGLLILYPIKFKESEETPQYPNPKNIHPLNLNKYNMGFGVFFPKTDNPVEIEYALNEIEMIKLEISKRTKRKDSEEDKLAKAQIKKKKNVGKTPTVSKQKPKLKQKSKLNKNTSKNKTKRSR